MNKTDIINIIKEELADVLREAKHVPPGTTDNPPPPPPDTGPHLNEARYTSNIDQKWQGKTGAIALKAMEKDLDNLVRHVYQSNGYEGLMI